MANPTFGMCCNHGKIRLPLLERPPEGLMALFVANDPQAREFRDNIRQYNMALAFTSMGVTEDVGVNRRGAWVFRILGQLSHYSGALLPPDDRTPCYAQLYLYDPHEALRYRMMRNDRLREDTMQLLQNTLRESHQYAQIYQHAYEVLRNAGDVTDASITLQVSNNHDRRRYNLPSADEVAMIMPGDEMQRDYRDIVLHLRAQQEHPLLRINEGHPAYSPLHYVLLFPHGEHGWHEGLRQYEPGRQVPKRLSQTRYAAYRLQVRRGEFSTILRGGRLFQQYVVDMWAAAEHSRLTFLRHNQDTLRASVYSGLEDAIGAGDADVDLNQLGQRVVLPSSFIGGPRHMQQRFQDAMAIARYYRKVDIFLTMTANPNWEEITRELLPGQTSHDRPDIVTRVFQLKKEALLSEITKCGIFGKAAAHVDTIEFQKRGLPHMHLLIFLENESKLLTPADVDSAISAEWPDPVAQPNLFQTVKKCMVHGPCGAMNPRAPCMEDDKCTKYYPKSFQPFTTMDDDGYPNYRRLDDGRTYDVAGHMVDNRWIVPYNPYLSAKFDCHINVECAVSIRSIKYPFKYIHKGGDRATATVENDEIKIYIDGRYLASLESCLRIYHMKMHDQVPNVVRLQVHLPGQHMVRFNPNEDPQALLERAANERTMLTDFFEANKVQGPAGDLARRHTYQEFPQVFVWSSGGTWTPRKRGFALGRMYFISPRQGELFYLRTLLTVVRGPTSFWDLRTFEGIQHATYQEACLARGLLEDDGEWRQCLREGAVMHVGSRLRQLFATILLFCNPSQPLQLWQEFREHICDDLRHHLRRMGINDPRQDDAYDYGLHLLNQILQQSGHTLQDFALPMPRNQWDLRVGNALLAEQFDYDPADEREQARVGLGKLNEEQVHAFQNIFESVRNNEGKTFFINGPGGTGKTFLYRVLCHGIRAESWVVLCVASSGIAAILLSGGRTAHFMFKIPVEGLDDGSVCSIPKQSHRATLLRAARLIIWDEITMQHRNAAEAVDRTLRDIRDDDRPFGGITTVFGGDYQQILPVVPKGSREEVVSATIQHSYLWNHIEVHHLKQNMRLDQTPEEQDFAKWLLDVGHGRGTTPDGVLKLPEEMVCRSSDSNELIDTLYPDVRGRHPPPDYFLGRSILAPRNKDVDGINLEILNRMAGEEITMLSADSVDREAGADGDLNDAIPVEYLRSLDASGLPPGELKMKPGCPLILLRNLAPAKGLCNGARMVLLRAMGRVLEVQLIGGDHNGEIALIPRVTLTPSARNSNHTFVLRRRQFPVKLAFAMSINKAQGQSFIHVGVDLQVPVFSHGQLYVALSRATSKSRIKVLLPRDNLASCTTTNIVYPEVLL